MYHVIVENFSNKYLTWGRGFDKIKTACNALYETPLPEYSISSDGIMVHCKANKRYLDLLGQEWVTTNDPIETMFREEDRQIVYAVLRHIQEKGFIKNADVREISALFSRVFPSL